MRAQKNVQHIQIIRTKSVSQPPLTTKIHKNRIYIYMHKDKYYSPCFEINMGLSVGNRHIKIGMNRIWIDGWIVFEVCAMKTITRTQR